MYDTNERIDLEEDAANYEDDDEIIKPRLYQRTLVETIFQQWNIPDEKEYLAGKEGRQYIRLNQPNDEKHYGSIVFMETGSGKSYISLMIIKHLFGESLQEFKCLSKVEIQTKRDRLRNLTNEELTIRPKIFFIVNTNQLVDQQSQVIDKFTDEVRVGRFQGGPKFKKFYTKQQWKVEFQSYDCFVFIVKKFHDLLIHGYLQIEQIDLIIFDEAHHSCQEHLYNTIMADFFYAGYDKSQKIPRPRILALTASPLKNQTSNYKHDIQNALQTLSNNLYSVFVPISKQQLVEMKNECQVEVQTFHNGFLKSHETINYIEEKLIKPIIEAVGTSEGIYSLAGNDNWKYQNLLFKMLNSQVEEEFNQQQDQQIVQFLTQRKHFIQLETLQTRKLDLVQDFRNDSDRALMMLLLTLIKNINNLIVEIGCFGFQIFLKDLLNDIETKNSARFKEHLQMLHEKINELIYSNWSSPRKTIEQSENQPNTELTNETFSISSKVEKLISILNHEHVRCEQDSNRLRAIIFVKDRSVAVYLKKVLEARLNVSEDLNSNEKEAKVDADEKFRIGYAIGAQGKSLASKAIKCTNTNMEDDYGQQNNEWMPQFSQVKMTNEELRKNIDRLKNNEINVLIATSVVEEGLDVSSCNLVICMSEILNIKSFIQTKGRARQKNSKYVFLCADEQQTQVIKTIKHFNVLNKRIQDIAYRDQAILPDENIISQKQKDPSTYFITKEKAKCTIKEAPIFYEILQNELLDAINNKSQISVKDFMPEDYKRLSQQEKNEYQRKFAHYDSQRHEFKPKLIPGRGNQQNINGRREFRQIMIVPKILKYFFYKTGGIVEHKRAMTKKKDAEGRVYLKAVQKLYRYGFFTDDLQTNLNNYFKPEFGNNDNQDSTDSMQQPAPSIQTSSPSQQTESTQEAQQQKSQKQSKILKQQVEAEKEQLEKVKEQFKRQGKKQNYEVENKYLDRNIDCSGIIKNDNQGIKSDINEQQNKQTLNQVYCLVFHGKENNKDENNYEDHSYPYKGTKNFVGILMDKNFSQINNQMQMLQESRQKLKNKAYLHNLKAHGLITEEQIKAMEQNQDILNIEITPIEIQFKKGDPYETQGEFIDHLQFFHLWVFYFIYNANYLFQKRILEMKFPFSDTLFATVFGMIYNILGQQKISNFQDDQNTPLEEFMFRVLGIKDPRLIEKYRILANQLQEKRVHGEKPDLKGTRSQAQPFIVPIVKKRIQNSEEESFQIDFKLIMDCLDYCKLDLCRLIFSDNCSLSSTMGKYGLIQMDGKSFDDENHDEEQEIQKQSKSFIQEKVKFIHSFAANQNLYVIMKHFDIRDTLEMQNVDSILGADLYQAQTVWNQKQIVLISKSNMYLRQNIYHDMNIPRYPSQRLKALLWGESMSVQEHYFSKTGIYLSQKENQELYKCSKERHFLDFSIQKTSAQVQNIVGLNSSNLTLDQSRAYPYQLNEERATSTEFDVPQQYIQMVPIQYQQYQTLQTCCFFYAQIHEILKIEKFIEKFFSEMKIKPYVPQFQFQKQDQLYLYQDTQAKTLDSKLQASLQKEPQPLKNKDFLECSNPEIQVDSSFNMSKADESTQDQSNIVAWIDQSKVEIHDLSIINNEASEVQDQSTQILSEFLLQNFDVMIEAMTAPTANKKVDYERLEFYGDSVISFLVILELFLTKDKNLEEGQLDFYRIQAVSNMNFAKKNESKGIYNYIILDPSKIYNDVIPPGFKDYDYQNKIKQKHLNEFRTKLTQLRKQLYFLDKEITQKAQQALSEYNQTAQSYKDNNAPEIGDYANEEFLHLVMMFLKQKDLNLIIQQRCPEAFEIVKQEKNLLFNVNDADEPNQDLFQRVGNRWSQELGLTIPYLKKIVIEHNIMKVENKYRLERENKVKKRSGGGGHSSEKSSKNFTIKQLADVVESITGAISSRAGLYSAQDFLRKMEILKHPLKDYQKELDLIKGQRNIQMENRFAKDLKKLQDKLGYQFRNPTLLLYAMIHKSFKESHNSISDNSSRLVEDYERLEFLGDSILNFLVSQYYFNETQGQPDKYKPKELHKMKTSIVNNVLLSLVVIDLGIHDYIIYNEKSEQFKKQFDHYVTQTKKLLSKSKVWNFSGVEETKIPSSESQYSKSTATGSSKSEFVKTSSGFYLRQIDMDQLHEHCLKIFGDVMESIIGAIFLDSQSIETTKQILFKHFMPFIEVYGNMRDIESLQDHARTKVLEFWNSKSYTKNLKIHHKVETKNEVVYFKGFIQNVEVRKVKFAKDFKNKVRRFYKDFDEFLQEFTKYLELKYRSSQSKLNNEVTVMSEVRDFRLKYKPPSSSSASSPASKAESRSSKMSQSEQKSVKTTSTVASTIGKGSTFAGKGATTITGSKANVKRE